MLNKKIDEILRLSDYISTLHVALKPPVNAEDKESIMKTICRLKKKLKQKIEVIEKLNNG
jgi:hypothetical protein